MYNLRAACFLGPHKRWKPWMGPCWKQAEYTLIAQLWWIHYVPWCIMLKNSFDHKGIILPSSYSSLQELHQKAFIAFPCGWPQNILICSLRSGSSLTNTTCRIPISITLLFSQTMFWHVLWLSIQLFQPLRYAICVFSHLGSHFFLEYDSSMCFTSLMLRSYTKGSKKQVNLGGSEEDTNQIP